MACARCSTGSEIEVKNAVVTDEGHIPICEELPEGANDTATGITLETMDLLPGFYRMSNKSTEILECYQDEACIGGDEAGHYCAEGYKGPCEWARASIEVEVVR